MITKNNIKAILINHQTEVDNFNQAVFEEDYDKVVDDLLYLIADDVIEAKKQDSLLLVRHLSI